jgi:hypothetical protein
LGHSDTSCALLPSALASGHRIVHTSREQRSGCDEQAAEHHIRAIFLEVIFQLFGNRCQCARLLFLFSTRKKSFDI